MRGAEAETTIDQGSGAAFVDFNGSSLLNITWSCAGGD